MSGSHNNFISDTRKRLTQCLLHDGMHKNAFIGNRNSVTDTGPDIMGQVTSHGGQVNFQSHLSDGTGELEN